eukprot:359940_1
MEIEDTKVLEAVSYIDRENANKKRYPRKPLFDRESYVFMDTHMAQTHINSCANNSRNKTTSTTNLEEKIDDDKEQKYQHAIDENDKEPELISEGLQFTRKHTYHNDGNNKTAP